MTKKICHSSAIDDYFYISPKRKDKKIAYVPIMTGCNNFCSYCVVPYTRGRERSRPMEEIVKEVEKLVKEGYQEIVLLGQNVNSYKVENQKSKIKNQKLLFVDLLKKLNALSGDFKIKFLTSHPKDMSEELIEAMATLPKISHELHLPVQSGDDEILKKMNRGYTVKQYMDLIKKIRNKIPDIKLSTDIIVGFPGETKKQFENTVKLCRKIKFDKAYIAQYSPRPGTAAFKLKDDVPKLEKKRRWRILEKLINS